MADEDTLAQSQSLLEKGDGNVSGQITIQQGSPTLSNKVVSFFKNAFKFPEVEIPATQDTQPEPAHIKKVYFSCVGFIKETFGLKKVAVTIIQGAIVAVGKGYYTQLQNRFPATTTYPHPPT